ncbi:MAG: hypothetical protein ACPGVS_06395 [Primorskyibacter sp.]
MPAYLTSYLATRMTRLGASRTIDRRWAIAGTVHLRHHGVRPDTQHRAPDTKGGESDA